MENENKKPRFHVTITDNENGETLLDTDSGAIIGGVDTEKRGHLIVFSHCDVMSLAHTLLLVEKAVQEQYEMHPELVPMVAAIKTRNKTQQTTETEGTEN